MDASSQRIRVVLPSGDVVTVAGRGGQGFETGPGANAQFSYPVGIAVTADGRAYVSDYNLNRIFEVK